MVVPWNKFYTKDPQILEATGEDLVALLTWRRRLVQPCLKTLKLTTHTLAAFGNPTEDAALANDLNLGTTSVNFIEVSCVRTFTI
jgi:hypothetical protein